MSVNGKTIHQSSNKMNEYLNWVRLSETTENTLSNYDYLNFYPEDADLLGNGTAIDSKYNITYYIQLFFDNIF